MSTSRVCVLPGCRLSGVAGAAHSAQRGMLLVELMIVAAVALALAVWGSHEWAERTRVLQARSLAAWMGTARDAVQAYLSQESARLAQGLAADGSAGGSLSAPGWQDLQAQGFLPGGWQARGPMGHELGLHLWQSGDCVGETCRLNALVYTRSALLRRSGQFDTALVAEWLLAADGRGLVLWPHKPDVFSGAGERVPLPVGGPAQWVPGTVALFVAQAVVREAAAGGGGSSETEDFLRVRDTRDPDFQNGVTAAGEVRSGTRVVARESIVLEDGWKGGTACPIEGAVGRDQNYAGVLICRQGKWNLVARATGGGYMLNSRRGCKNILGTPTPNPYTGECLCPAGFSVLQVSESGSMTAPEGLTMGYLCIPN
ncbi:hypothetical protein [Castellaniella sp.]|uniref:hypothetical protein n=1 Tax=Castellaniella sp. TaxID=1955812 RepID=UPI0025BAB737|nr:hypothetical protein [Castellaniella sp.]